MQLPHLFVVALEHAGLDVWRHEPMVAAWIEVFRVTSDRRALIHLKYSVLGPDFDQGPQVQVVVHCIVVKLLLVDAVALVLKAEVEPVHNVEDFDRLLEELVVDLGSLDDVQR